jgi:hypothetical protein
MTDPNHYQVLCSVCGKVIEQCRCPAPDKPITYGLCEDCKAGKPLIEAVFVDDFKTISKPEKMTKEELERRNKQIDNLGLDEYGRWEESSRSQED